jgi:gliding motility-associated-like protein
MILQRRNFNRIFLIGWFCFLVLNLFADTDPSPIKFIQNKNQWPSSIDFAARIPAGSILVSSGSIAYNFLDYKRIDDLHELTHVNNNDGEEGNSLIRGHSVVVNFIGANRQSAPLPFGKSNEYYNYFIGNDPEKWASEVYAFNGFIYPEFYKGIDFKMYGSGENIKYDFIVSPNADPSQILVNYQGAEELYTDNGNLYIKNKLAEIVERKPFAYQIINGKKVEVICEYVLVDNQIQFHFPASYDACHELVIDPLLIFSTYSGSAADNWGSTATPGENGTLYSGGVTNHFISGDRFSGTFPATPGAFQTTYGQLFDIGILKYDSAGGQLLYASYLGGSDSESAHSFIVNNANELIVFGTTGSANFPTTDGAFDRTFSVGSSIEHVITYSRGSDIVISRISSDGTQLLSSTFVGGTDTDGLNFSNALAKNYGDQLRGDVITDAENNIYISSVTASDDFPISDGFETVFNGGETDAILLKFKPDLSEMIWGTFLGGSGTDASHTIKLDHKNNIFIGGGTTSSDFPVTTGSYQTIHSGNADGWVAKISADGSKILNGTFTGTSSFDQVYFLDLNESEEVYIYGQTSGAFPVTQGVYNNANSGQLVQKFNNTLSTLIFSTVFGSGRGVPDISPTAFLVNDCNNLYMTGWGGALNQVWGNSTRGMPVSDDAFQRTSSGNDFYFIVLTDDATRFLYGTYLGGSQSLTHVDGGTSRFDKSGVVYHAVCSGCNTDGQGPKSDFPTTAGAWSRQNRSRNCNNAAFKFDLSSLRARLQTNSVVRNFPGMISVCMPDKILFENLSIGGEVFEWNFGDGTLVTRNDTTAVIHEYKKTGNYLVKLKAIDQGTCKVVDSTSIVVKVFDFSIVVQDDDDVCEGSSYQLKASGGLQYLWRSEDETFSSSQPRPFVNVVDTTTYFVTVTDRNGCVEKDTVTLDLIPRIVPEFEYSRVAECDAVPDITLINLTDSLSAGDQVIFDFGDGIRSDEVEVNHHYEKEGKYAVKLIGMRAFCTYETTLEVPVFPLVIPNVITPNGDRNNDVFSIRYGKQDDKPSEFTPGDFGYKCSMTIYNRWGNVIYENADYQYDWAGEGLASGVYYYEVSVEDHATCKSWIHLIK